MLDIEIKSDIGQELNDENLYLTTATLATWDSSKIWQRNAAIPRWLYVPRP